MLLVHCTIHARVILPWSDDLATEFVIKLNKACWPRPVAYQACANQT